MLRKILLICFLLCLILPVYIFSQALSSHPLVIQLNTPDAEDARKSKDLAKRMLSVLQQRNRTTLLATEDELNSVVAFLARGSSRLAGQFRLTPQGLDGIFSIRLPKTLLGEYLNLTLTLLPSERGLNIAQVELGSLDIPGPLILLAGQFGIDLLLGNQVGSETLAAIEQVSFERQRIAVRFSSGANLVELKNRLQSRLKTFRNNVELVGDSETIRYYYQQLAAMGQVNLGREKISLTSFMTPLFQLAEIRSQQSDAIEENRAALYALAIYLGSHHFLQFTGELSATDSGPETMPHLGNVVLAGRQDLRLHFLVSAGLKLLSDSKMGFAVGEFKELLDAGQGGSGFSFVDLAADRTGLAFVERATRSVESAVEFQHLMAQADEEAFYFPEVLDLEEGLDQKYFAQEYGDIDSARYREVVRLIDERLGSLPLYR